jgi:hypothetical protein
VRPAVLLLRQVKAPRMLLGPPDLGSTLRYKKKMLLWKVAPAAAQNVKGSGALAAPDAEEEAMGVGYCMMTFIIRNGLGSLRLGLQTYQVGGQAASGILNNQGRPLLCQIEQAQVRLGGCAW